ncbi:4294_t:CDS:2 [Funneliformis caledonium]|uniref:4294_t:CDS:1 n=1 Tax=Funneliformis caledonium TaxID=1117310 RepID=A0A9N8VEH4_9GLOM|nr:4294_t:CDS:2 [Funneliformis caledonium]
MAAPQESHALDESSRWDTGRYHSIEDISNSKRVETFAKEGPLNVCDWVVTEKIHGSNLSFITNGVQVQCAKRSRPLSDSEEFFGFQSVKEKYFSNILKLWRIMSTRNLIHSTLNSSEKIVTIYGELFGGRYSHPDVKPVNSAVMCQFGIEYCPQNEFMAFDIFDGNDYLDYDLMTEIFAESGVPFNKPLFRGSFEDAYRYDPKFTTTIPSIFGLPPLPFPNKAEGVIIKPVKTLHVTSGATRQTRVILKIKSPDFVERVRSKKREFRETSRSERKKPREPMDNLFAELATFINENRVASVISKFGPIVTKGEEESELNERINQVSELLYKDALTDFNKDDELRERTEKLPNWQQEVIWKRGNAEAMKVVKEYARKIKSVHLDNSKRDSSDGEYE